MRFQKNVLSLEPDFQEKRELIEEYVERKKKEGFEISIGDVRSARKKIAYDIKNKEYYEIIAQGFGYKKQREVLDILIDKLYAGNKDRFKDREEVFEIIARSAFTGDVVGKQGWGRLVDETFGSGTFGKIALLDSKLSPTKRLKSFIEKLSFAKNVDEEIGLDKVV